MSKINITARPFNLKLKHPFGISRGSILYAKNVLLTLAYGDIVAYGEAAPSVYYGEDQDSVIEFVYGFIKRKPVEDYLTNIHKLKEDLDFYSQNYYPAPSYSARVAIEMVFWDLIGKLNNKSLYQYFFKDDPFLSDGSEYSFVPPTSYTIGIDDISVIKEKVKQAIASGHKILKVKLGLGYDEDVNVLKTISDLMGDSGIKLRVDANGGWDLKTAERIIDVLPLYKVELLEQPLPKGSINLLFYLTQKSTVPIFVDEDCLVVENIEALAGKVNGINIKLMKSGSIIETINMFNLASSYNLKTMLGCMIESSCAISAAVHMSPMADYVDLDGHMLLERDPFTGLQFSHNKVIPSFDSGLGVYLSEY